MSGGDEGVGGVGPTDRLRTLVQEVAQAALPLAQLIPLIHEDLQVIVIRIISKIIEKILHSADLQ